jgi:glycosyltransferase involved in cell wall biosynthesis
MGLGRAIVASELGQAAEILEDGRTARLVPPADVGALAAAIDELARSPSLREELGRNARSEAEQRHTWTIRAAAILDAVAAG